jgi:hypothetical protein
MIPLPAPEEAPQRAETLRKEGVESSGIPVETVDVDSCQREEVTQEGQGEGDPEKPQDDQRLRDRCEEGTQERHISSEEIHVIKEELPQCSVEGKVQLQPGGSLHEKVKEIFESVDDTFGDSDGRVDQSLGRGVVEEDGGERNADDDVE